jgi:hypothetical protein
VAKVKVYRFKSYDVTREESLRGPLWGTLKAIDMLGRCIAIKETEMEVDEEMLDSDGFLSKEWGS